MVRLLNNVVDIRNNMSGITMLGPYKGSTVKTTFECPNCGNVFSALPRSIWDRNTTSCGCLGRNRIGYCRLTGIELSWGTTRRDCDLTASLDRVDSKIGYRLDNLQWIYKKINHLKRNYSDDYFKFLCKEVVNFNYEFKGYDGKQCVV